MRKPLILKQRKTVLAILTTMSDADLYYVMGVCNGLIQSRQAKKDELLHPISQLGEAVQDMVESGSGYVLKPYQKEADNEP